MFKKLIIAVLTLGLLLAFSSAAISSDTPKVGVNRVETFNPDAPKANLAKEVPHPTPSITKPSNALNALLTPSMLTLPPDTFTWCQDYSGGAAAYFWRLTDRYDDSLFGMRFTSNEGYTCTLKTAAIGVYGAAIFGNPGMRVYVFDDDGFGLPGAVQGYVDVAPASLPHAGMYYYSVDISSLGLVYSDGEEFHIGVSKTGVDGDTLAILSDDGSAGQLRSWDFWGGNYYLMNDDWGLDANFLIEACGSCARIPYTSCYTQTYACNVAYFWTQPDAYGDDYFNMRFSVEGPETLKSVSIALYGAQTVGTPDLDVFVWGDDGAGYPNLGDVIASVTVPNASIVYFPSYNVIDLSSLNLVMTGDFHVGWSTNDVTGGTLAGLSDDGSCGAGRSSEYYLGAFSSMLNDWGADVNFLIDADLCKDEFSNCVTLSDFDLDYYYWRYPDRYGDIGAYQLFGFKGEGCRIDNINVRFFWSRLMYNWPLYTTNSELQVYTVDGVTGLPDTKVFSQTITPGNYGAITPTPSASTRWWKTFDISSSNFRYDEMIWVGLESFAPDTLSGFFLLSDDGLTGDLRSCETWGPGAFGFMLDDWGLDVDHGITLDVCCVPIAECACAPGADWPTMGGNFARSGHSGNTLGNAQCNLTKSWEYVAGQVAVFNSPVIYKDTVVCYFLDRLAALDVNTGAQIWLRLSDPFVIGAASYATPTVYNGLIYVAGGSAKSFSALSVTTGATVWTRNFSAHSNHFVTFGPSVIVNVGGTDVVYYTDDFGWVYAVDALTGALFPGWVTNPVKLPQAIVRGVTTDGARLFVGTTIGAASGDIYALDPATGAQLWQLSGAGGLQAATIVPPKDYGGFEGFPNAISVANEGVCGLGASNVIYTCSYYPIADNTSPVQQGGVLYSINAADGSLNWAILAHNGSGGYSMPNIDASRVIHQSWPYWTTSGDHRGPIGVNRNSGAIEWTNTYPSQPYLADFPLMEGVLSCEDEVSDIFVGVYRSNFAKFFQADNGAPMFHRRFTGYLSGAFSVAGHRVAPVMDDGHLLLTWRNKIVALTNQVDRPRLDLPHYVIDVPVEFGSPNPTNATFADAIANSGCTPLQIISITLDEIDNNTTPTSAVIASANQERLSRLSSAVDRFNPKTDNWSLAFADETDITISETSMNSGFSLKNAAFAPPPYVNNVISPLNGSFVAAGDTVDLIVSVNGPMITRGRHAFYAYIHTDDPDYFLDSAKIDDPAYAIPQIECGLIGGCLYASARLSFGTSSSNYKIIWNSGFQADGDSTSFSVDGASSQLWQGALVYAKSKYQVALHAQNWHAIDFFWKSLLSDPECVNGGCPPQLASNVVVGAMSSDNGATYANLMANVMTFSYVDSMQNMDDDTSAVLHWWWAYPWDYLEDPPYDDTLTVGFKACVKVIGVTGNAAFNNFIIERHAVSARYGQAVNDLYLTGMIDYDVTPNNARQMVGYDAAHSLAYVYDCGSPVGGWGYVKIPFGCGYEPMINAKTVTASMGSWNDSDIWLDSVYYWASNNVGLSHQPGTDPCATDPDDRDAYMTFAKNSFSGSDSGIYCFANFARPGIASSDVASNYFGIANLANQFCGFGRGDVNNDGVINIVDIVYLAAFVNFGGNGPFPFEHLGDVNIDGSIDINDVLYLKAFYFNGGPCPQGKWEI